MSIEKIITIRTKPHRGNMFIKIKEHQRADTFAQNRKQVQDEIFTNASNPTANLYFIFHAGVPFFIVAFHFNNVCRQPIQPINILN
jgi:hypothetical protein